MVSDTPDVEAVLFGPDGVAEGASAGSLVVDMSTISPSATRDFAERLAARGVAMLDGPVSGGSEGAKKGTLSIFIGGEAADLERARPVLESLGTTITHVGPIGSGQAVKAVNQVILAGTYLGVAEGIVLAIKAGLDVEQTGGRAVGRRRAVVGPHEPQRPDDGQRLPARLQGLAAPQGPRDRARDWRASWARRCRSARCARRSRPGSSATATPTTTCPPSRARSAPSPAWRA